MKYFLIAVAFLPFSLLAASVDTVNIYSDAMKKEFKCVVVKPDKYKKQKAGFPVVYLLHGWSGGFNNWIKKVPAIKEYADRYQLMIVCPDGAYSSWYFDSPVDATMRYETYIALEVPAYIDAHYKTIKDRKARAITGLSMGGHGGLFLSFRHADLFSGGGSMSGAVDLNSLKNKYEIYKLLGDTNTYSENWKKYSVMNIIENKPADSLALIIDCGIDDFFYTDNKMLHQKMMTLKIPHDFIERPGKHDWAYWANAVEYQLAFFAKYFSRN